MVLIDVMRRAACLKLCSTRILLFVFDINLTGTTGYNFGGCKWWGGLWYRNFIQKGRRGWVIKHKVPRASDQYHELMAKY